MEKYLQSSTLNSLEDQRNNLSQLAVSTFAVFISQTESLVDTGLLLEKEIGLGNIYAMISSGHEIEEISKSLNLPADDLLFILSRTETLRGNLLSAQMHYSATKSLKLLDGINTLELSTEQASAARHHSSIVIGALKNRSKTEKGNKGVMVINQINVDKGDSIPEVPEELREVIDVIVEQ